LTVHLTVYPAHISLVVHEDIMGDCVKSFAEIKLNNIHCSPHQSKLAFYTASD